MLYAPCMPPWIFRAMTAPVGYAILIGLAYVIGKVVGFLMPNFAGMVVAFTVWMYVGALWWHVESQPIPPYRPPGDDLIVIGL